MKKDLLTYIKVQVLGKAHRAGEVFVREWKKGFAEKRAARKGTDS